MGTHVALMRGINVGGRHRLPMARVREGLSEAGFGRVRTHIQSGNVVLDSDLPSAEVAERLTGLLEDLAGFPVPTVVLPAGEFVEVLRACPFSPPVPKLAHVVLLPHGLDAARAERLLALRAVHGGPDDLAVGGRAVHLLHPEGLARSVLAARAMALLPDGTARNLATMAAVEAMLAG